MTDGVEPVVNARRYVNAVNAVVVCPRLFVCQSVYDTSVLYHKG